MARGEQIGSIPMASRTADYPKRLQDNSLSLWHPSSLQASHDIVLSLARRKECCLSCWWSRFLSDLVGVQWARTKDMPGLLLRFVSVFAVSQCLSLQTVGNSRSFLILYNVLRLFMPVLPP